jgi:sugar lactone lactonase YvrE
LTKSSFKNTLEEVIGKAKIEKITNGFEFTEGPVWVPDMYLLFSDIPANIIYKWIPDVGSTEIFRKPSGHSNGLTLDKTGRLLACEHDRRVTRTEKKGKIVPIATHFEGKLLNSPNDIVVRSDNSIYFTDPPYGLPRQEEGKELDFNGIFRITMDGTLTLLDDSFDRPNGIAFSPDEKILYVNDSQRGHIRSFDVHSNGTISNSQVFAKLKSKEEGVPDGMKVDLCGNVFCTGPGGIWVLSEGGEIIGVIKVPEVSANLAWGDSDLKSLYITARTGLYRTRVRTGGTPLVKE